MENAQQTQQEPQCAQQAQQAQQQSLQQQQQAEEAAPAAAPPPQPSLQPAAHQQPAAQRSQQQQGSRDFAAHLVALQNLSEAPLDNGGTDSSRRAELDEGCATGPRSEDAQDSELPATSEGNRRYLH